MFSNISSCEEDVQRFDGGNVLTKSVKHTFCPRINVQLEKLKLELIITIIHWRTDFRCVSADNLFKFTASTTMTV